MPNTTDMTKAPESNDVKGSVIYEGSVVAQSGKDSSALVLPDLAAKCRDIIVSLKPAAGASGYVQYTVSKNQ